jgi:hypothetical protein
MGFQQPDGRHPGIGIDGIHQAGAEKIDRVGSVWIISFFHGFTFVYQ